MEFVDHDSFRLELTALCISAHLDLRELLGQPVLLELLTAESHVQRRPSTAMSPPSSASAAMAGWRATGW